uniref:Reverse transcriptase domain-containing protein n=1 Tax=Macrostomum lignano TaxID=282301 RepID=A0A1I8HFS8_9PLAT
MKKRSLQQRRRLGETSCGPSSVNVELPEESSLNISPITIDEVLQLAKKTPGNKATGPDDVPVEVLLLPQVALEVRRVMNCVLAGGPAPAEWRTAHIVGIPKKPGS